MTKIVSPYLKHLPWVLGVIPLCLLLYIPAILGIVLFVPSLGWSWKLTILAGKGWSWIMGIEGD